MSTHDTAAMDGTTTDAAQTPPSSATGESRNAASQEVLNHAMHELAHMMNPDDSAKALAKATAFVEQYCAELDNEDLARIGARGLAQTVADHFELGRERQPAAINVEFRNVAQPRGGYVGHLDVVVDDMPFVVSSIMGVLAGLGLGVLGLAHPTFSVLRDRDGRMVQVIAHHAGSTVTLDTMAIPTITNLPIAESWVHIDVTPADDDVVRLVGPRVRAALSDVNRAFRDWKPMVARMEAAADGLRRQSSPVAAESAELLKWLANDHFTLLGYEERDLMLDVSGVSKTNGTSNAAMVTVRNSGLGVLADTDRGPEALPVDEAEIARNDEPLIVTKEAERSTVHRDVYYDELLVKRYADDGKPNGEYRFLGLFTQSVYAGSVTTIPFLQERVARILEIIGFEPTSYTGRHALSALETYPRDELFQDQPEHLATTIAQIQHLDGFRRTRTFLRMDRFHRFVTAIVYMPKDVYSTSVRLNITDILVKATRATDVTYESRMDNSALARLYFVLRLPHADEPFSLDEASLQQQIAVAATSWVDALRGALGVELGYDVATQLASEWANGFPGAYREAYGVETAARDLRLLLTVIDRGRERVLTGALPIIGGQARRGNALSRVPAVLHPLSAARRVGLIVEAYVPVHEHDERVDLRLKLYQGAPLALAEILPILASLKLEIVDERLFEIEHDDDQGYIYDFGLRADGLQLTAPTLERLRDVFAASRLGWVEADPYNRIVLDAEITWRQADILRAYVRYLRQLRILPYSATFAAEILAAYPAITRQLIARFVNKFDPDLGTSLEARRTQDVELAQSLEAAFAGATGIDADTVLRRINEAIAATERTNAYQLDELQRWKSPLAMKMSPRHIAGVVSPVPLHEIWVYSPLVEGVHLRFGAVARGGLRWSDRREDFRTEILGLVKAQIVKNAVIVPTGAKGGFYAKQLPPATDRDAWFEAGKQAYRAFIGALLDVTDNQRTVRGSITVLPPERVVRYDPDDPYLVIAADKGTASFSDIANDIATARGFWLGDAFASGGSHGYDHKAMGITARGAWESVTRHFQELGINVATDPFTMIGIGDMSGDVFGNGLLRTRTAKLVAAFDHRHIFVDPTPNPELTYAERERLFNLPRSNWAEFDGSIISQGGGVFSRTAKAIHITPQMATALGIDVPTAHGSTSSTLTPTELIQVILKAPVDLLYNGGIGTYVKSAHETNADVGDKQNDAIRIDGEQLRVRVVGEGGNLGLTQRGRIEAALNGVLLNTDAIDNSAGVDTSDHEVNIKIALSQLKLDDVERDTVLQSMTDDVAESVLSANYEQNRLLSVDRRSVPLVPAIKRELIAWEDAGTIDRALEYLPSDEVIDARFAHGEGFTLPELSVILAYAKIVLTGKLLESNLFDDPWYAAVLRRYFPKTLVERAGRGLIHHPLAKEIMATTVANHFVDRAGLSFWFTQEEETNADIAQVTKAWTCATIIFGVDEFYAELKTLEQVIEPDAQRSLIVRMRRMLTRAVRWLIEHDRGSIDATVAHFETLKPLREALPDLASLSANPRGPAEIERLVAAGVPLAMARAHSVRLNEHSLLDVVDLSRDVSLTALWVGKLYEAVSERYTIHALLFKVAALPKVDVWQGQSRAALRDDLYAAAHDITAALMALAQRTGVREIDQLFAEWETSLGARMSRVRTVLNGAAAATEDDVAPLVVALRALRTLV